MSPPRIPKRPVTRVVHGRVSRDDYAWLRDDERRSPEVLDHLAAENTHTAEVLAHTVDLQETLFEEIRGRILETDLSVPGRFGQHWYYTRTVEGLQYPIHCRLAAGDEPDPPDPDQHHVRAAEEVLLDQNVEAGDREYFAIGMFDLSPEVDVVAWSADDEGSERYTVRFRDLVTGTDRTLPDGLVEEIADVSYGSAWSADGRYLFYTRPDEANRPHEVWCHRLGRPVSEDRLVHREDDERFACSIGETKDRQWLVLAVGSSVTTEIRIRRTDDVPDGDGPEGDGPEGDVPSGDLASGFATLAPRRAGIEVEAEHLDGRFYLLTNDAAFDFRIVTAEPGAGGPEHWVDVVPHRPGVRVEGFDVVRDHLVVEERAAATTRIRVRRLGDGHEFLLSQPEEISTIALGANDDLDWPLLRHTYTSLVTPPTVADVDLRTGQRTVRKVQAVLGGHDPERYLARRLWATAPDGEAVPVSLVHRRDRRPGGPVLLYGYGAYEISVDPVFSVSRLSLLDRGWAFAIAHVRGGGEMGRRWYEAGRFEAKPNSFDDLVAAGEALVADGVAGAERVALRGGSAGGLLVGAALNRAPGAWAAVVAEVPFVDALNTMLDPGLPLTAGEWDEWGNPAESPAVFDVMAGYSPYENVPSGAALPPVLATGGLHDPRVGYWEPAKWVARLREDTDGGPFLLRTELGAGHGGPSGRYDAWRDEALVLAFLIDRVGVGDLGGGTDPDPVPARYAV